MLTKYGQTQKDRLAFIDLRLRFFGEVRRADLMERFGIETAAATRDFALYRELEPGNLEYDTKGKIYRQGRWFRPLFDFAAERVLNWLYRGYGDNFPDKFRPLFPIESTGLTNPINLDILSIVTRAIHLRKVIQISYRSLTSGLTTRELVPFALADNGFRWHVRGFDRKQQEFHDLVLTRIADAILIDGEVYEPEMPEKDIQWNRIVELEMVPHPANIQHPDTIEADYGMTDGILKICVRAALAGYVLCRWNVDCSPDHRLRGLEFHLWLKNRAALYGVVNLNLAPGYE